MQRDERRGSEPRQTVGGRASNEIAQLRATCRRQASVIDTLTRVVGNLRGGVSALKAENAELRAECSRRSDLDPSRGGPGALERSDWFVARVPLDVDAPAAAGDFVVQLLGER